MKKILVMNFFPAFTPPASGGELRYYNIYNELSKYYDITLLSPTYSNHKHEIISHSENFREYRIPKSADIHDKLHWLLYCEGINTECSALVCSLSASYPNNYHDFYLKLYPDSDIIIHDCPFMLDYDLFLGFDNKPRIYNSYNYEYKLMKQIFKGENTYKYLNHIYNLENRIMTQSDLIFAVSEDEKKKFMADFHVPDKKIKIAPNGIDPKYYNKIRDNHKNNEVKKAFFIGSAHPPNNEAVDFIINELADKCSSIQFLIAGLCCNNFKDVKKNNVNLLGVIDEKTKKDLFSKVDIAINPMFSGGGTNLKTLEFLSAGIPMVATDIGARGLDLENNNHFLLADKNNFFEKIIFLAENKKIYNQLSINSKNYINNKFSWKSIALSIKNEIDTLSEINKKKRSRLLLLNDFKVSNPSHGGEIRINKLYSDLSNYFEIVLLCLNNDQKFLITEITDHYKEISIPKTIKHINTTLQNNKKFWVETSDITTSDMITENDFFCKIFKVYYNISDLIIFIHPYMINVLDTIENPKKPIIHESLNIETNLKKNILLGHPDYKKLIKTVKMIEDKSFLKSDLIISVSEEEKKIFSGMYNKKINTIQNGVELKSNDYYHKPFINIKKMFNDKPIAVFIGSGHKPNIYSLKFIIDVLSINMPDFVFLIIGSVCDDKFVTLNVTKNIFLFGKIDSEYKDALLSIADIALNPMYEGAGSNLKLPEYFSAKIPVVTTPFGARGYDITDHEEVIISELENFEKNIRYLYNNKLLKNKLAENAFKYVKKNLDWKFLAKKYADIINENFYDKNKKKLLIITYRFTNPPLGGAEVHLKRLADELEKINEFKITIITLNIYEIYNKYHFSMAYTFKDDFETDITYQNINIIKLDIDKIDDNLLFNNSKKIFSFWMKEWIDTSNKFLKYYTQPLLMGGWYYPENCESNYEIWSSSKSLIFLNKADFISIKGYTPKKQNCIILSDNEEIYNKSIEKEVNISLNLNKCKVLTIKTSGFYSDKDPKLLGIKIFKIQYKADNNLNSLRLDYDYKNFLKEYYLDEYINELIRIANNRKKEDDELFLATRGPASVQLSDWLDNNIKKYDIVISHNIPFYTSLLAGNYSKKFNKSFVFLPHFHFEDEFYHWKSCYNIIKNADCILSSTKTAIELFFNKICSKTIYIKGGIDPNEFEHFIEFDFKQIYSDNLPFILILGRKSGAKNYKWVINSIEKLNKDRKKCNLLIIGKDEDKVRIDENNALYIGEQSREIVFSFLKNCFCLVNMSESESFGLVILEAWMFKKAVIVNENCNPFTELVEDNINGIYANKDNLSMKIDYLLNNPDIAIKLGNKGYEKTINNFTWEKTGLELNTILKDLINKKMVK